VSVTGVRVKNQKLKINFIIPHCINAPLGVVVPKLPVPMMEWLAGKKN
jgi:hypothetical protein